MVTRDKGGKALRPISLQSTQITASFLKAFEAEATLEILPLMMSLSLLAHVLVKKVITENQK